MSATTENKLKPPPDMQAFLAQASVNPPAVSIGAVKGEKPEAPETPQTALEPAGPAADTPKAPPAAPAARKKAQRATKAPPKPAAKQKPAAEAATKPPAQPPRQAYPWEGATPRIKQTFNLRMPEDDYLKLKWLGDTQYGETMHSIALAAVCEAVNARLKALGIEPPKPE
ncbi:hypothetical protein [Paraburkholderia sp. MM6662-R1]|uniref:hypothetical protein n=1 Tax=Paraburkholderia sp. MM6662-R1 TaxID=2991066 RepID=UPI003D1ADE85